jgi:hypothetical protein
MRIKKEMLDQKSVDNRRANQNKHKSAYVSGPVKVYSKAEIAEYEKKLKGQ